MGYNAVVIWFFSSLFIALILAMFLATRRLPPDELILLSSAVLASFLSTGQLIQEIRRVVRLGWRLPKRQIIWLLLRSDKWNLRTLVSCEEFQMTPSFHPGRPLIWNLVACVQLREELEKEWARQAKVDVALDWVAERRTAEKSEEGSRKESEGV